MDVTQPYRLIGGREDGKEIPPVDWPRRPQGSPEIETTFGGDVYRLHEDGFRAFYSRIDLIAYHRNRPIDEPPCPA